VATPARPVRTSELARALGVTREHLSRSFRGAVGGGRGGTGRRAPTLKRVSDLVRLLAAAQLAKNPGYDLEDVARLLGFPSRAHLSRTARRLLGRSAASLPRLRMGDVLRQFERTGPPPRTR
jgi:transcriptional regulator GlxA family with amidase domain